LNKLLIRRTRPDDLSVLAEIEKECFIPCDVFSARVLKRMISNPAQSIIAEVLEYEGTVCGYAAFLTRKGSHTVRLYSVAVLRRCRGRGLARRYLQEKLDGFSEMGYRKLVLEVRKTNQAAIKLYGSLGFVTVGVLPGYYPDGQDGYRMEKYLRQTSPATCSILSETCGME